MVSFLFYFVVFFSVVGIACYAILYAAPRKWILKPMAFDTIFNSKFNNFWMNLFFGMNSLPPPAFMTRFGRQINTTAHVSLGFAVIFLAFLCLVQS